MKVPGCKYDKRFEKCMFLVEADSYAYHQLWYMHSGESGVKNDRYPMKTQKWIQDCSGCTVTIGHVDSRPVAITFFFYKINNQLVAFYNCCSAIADYTMIREFLKKNFNYRWDGGTRWAHCDAVNFHHCLDAVDFEYQREQRLLPMR